jgi:UDP-N-acetyl-D-mannosaminuronic acid transferase (WecB/TagA/CpsF family)
VSRSSAEAEYRTVAHAVAETVWIKQLMEELRRPIQQATLVYCDNISVVYLSANPVQHRRTKHIEIDLHFARESVQLGHVRVYMSLLSHNLQTSLPKAHPLQYFRA